MKKCGWFFQADFSYLTVTVGVLVVMELLTIVPGMTFHDRKQNDIQMVSKCTCLFGAIFSGGGGGGASFI